MHRLFQKAIFLNRSPYLKPASSNQFPQIQIPIKLLLRQRAAITGLIIGVPRLDPIQPGIDQ